MVGFIYFSPQFDFVDTSINIDLVRKWVARSSVGSSTVRGQVKCKKDLEGNRISSGIVSIITSYLEKLPLDEIKKIIDKEDHASAQEEYQDLLDDWTEKLQNELDTRVNCENKKREKFWGISRKCLNIFLIKVFHDKYLSKKYMLDNLDKFLELPLDTPNMKCLLKEKTTLEEKCALKHQINELTKKDNERYQAIASRIVANKIKRYQLDFYWRDNNKECWGDLK